MENTMVAHGYQTRATSLSLALVFKVKKRKPPIFTSCKRSLGQGNVFTPVCHSVHRESSLSRGVSVRGICLGGLCPRGVSVWGVSDLGDTPWQRPPPCTVTSGRYASYWNTFLFSSSLSEKSSYGKTKNDQVCRCFQLFNTDLIFYWT